MFPIPNPPPSSLPIQSLWAIKNTHLKFIDLTLLLAKLTADPAPGARVVPAWPSVSLVSGSCLFLGLPPILSPFPLSPETQLQVTFACLHPNVLLSLLLSNTKQIFLPIWKGNPEKSSRLLQSLLQIWVLVLSNQRAVFSLLTQRHPVEIEYEP